MEIQNEMDVLLSEAEVGPYKIIPWSLGRFKKVLSPLLLLLKPLKEMGLTLEMDEAAFKKFILEKGIEIILLVPEGLEALTKIIAGTLDISEQESQEIDLDLSVAILVAIISQNIQRLKNSLPLIMGQIKTIIRAA